MSLAQYNGSNVGNTERVWYTGTNTLKGGQIVSVDLTASTSLPAGATSSPITDFTLPRNLLGSAVADPNSAQTGGSLGNGTASNVPLTQGIVIPGQGSLVGPCWVEVQKPVRGDIVQIYNNVSATAGATVFGAATGTNTAASVANVTTPTTAGIAISLQTLDNSGTAGLTYAQFV